MAFRDWLRPPRQVLTIFLIVAALSTAALGWLTWRLLAQEAQLEAQRGRERLEQAADAAVIEMRQSVASLSALATGSRLPDAMPADVTVVRIAGDTIVVHPQGSLPYVPAASRAADAPAAVFQGAEQIEHGRRNLAQAARLYAAAAKVPDVATRAGALARLARVRRGSGDAVGALAVYADLEAMGDGVAVFGLPAPLVAAEGRLTVLAEAQRTRELRRAVHAFAADLARGRWPLLRAEYEASIAKVRAHAPDAAGPATEALTRAEALDWIKDNLSTVPPTGQKLIGRGTPVALAVWQIDEGRTAIALAGPSFLAALCTTTAATRCTLTDLEGRSITSAAPAGTTGTIRLAAATRLPWNVQFYSASGRVPSTARTRGLLIAILVGVAAVLGAGWYFILRAIGREARVARLQTDFVAAVSHEFRSPLTSLSHLSAMLAEDRVTDDALRRRTYQVLVRDTERLRRLVESLLDFGRFESGESGLRREETDLTALVRETVHEFRDSVRADGYSVTLQDELPSIPMYLDREAVSRALWNLLDNAVKYSPDDRHIEVRVNREPERAAIEVCDHGLGIPAHERAEIFNRFTRGADSKARRIRGTGIGLALVCQIVRAHGGEVEVASEVARGSTFRIVLPIAPASGETAPAALQPSRS